MVVCRLCLSNKANDYIEISKNQTNKSELSNLIETHLNLDGIALDVSNCVCVDCYVRLTEFHKYWLKINQTQKLLRNTKYKTINNHTAGENATPKAGAHCTILKDCSTVASKNTSCKRNNVNDENKKMQGTLLDESVDPVQDYVLKRLRSCRDVQMPKLNSFVYEKTTNKKTSSTDITEKKDVPIKTFMDEHNNLFKCKHCLNAFKNSKIIKKHKSTCENCPLHNLIFPSEQCKQFLGNKHNLRNSKNAAEDSNLATDPNLVKLLMKLLHEK